MQTQYDPGVADREPKRRTRSVVEPAPERRRVDWREALRLRRLGLTDSEIGRQLGFKSSSITRRLERHGVAPREQSSDDLRNSRPELRALRSAVGERRQATRRAEH